MNRNDLPDTNSIKSNYQQFKNLDINWLWYDEYYNGPLSGMIELNGNKYWAYCIDEEELMMGYMDREGSLYIRIFSILDIGRTRVEYQEYWHDLFKICIGDDICDIENDMYVKNLYDSAAKQFFYGRHKTDYKEIDLSKCTIIGWFTN